MSLASLALGAGRANATTGRDVVDIITFIEAPWGLRMSLFPVQRVILKAYYGVPLDNNPMGYPLDVPVPTTHPNYDSSLMDVTGYYKYRVPVQNWRRETLKVLTEEEYLADVHKQGRCNIGTVVAGQERREMVLSVGRRSGKCVTGNTLVLTDEGVRPIAELGDVSGTEFQPLDVGVAQEGNERSRSAYFYNGGVQPTYKVTSYSGFTVEGTASHRIKVLGADGVVGWRRLEDVREGEFVAIHRNTNLWASEAVDVRAHHVSSLRRTVTVQPDTFSERWGLLLGYLVGDGCWTDKTMLRVAVAHPETHAEVRTLFQELCGKVSFHKDTRTRSGLGSIYVCGRALRRFLHNLGYSWDKKAGDKQTPWVILRSPKPVVRAYLQGLFETDGTVSANGLTVSFCTASRQLAYETQLLLLNFGVVSRLRVKHNKKSGRDYYDVVIRGLRSRQTFSDEIGFRSLTKQGRLDTGLRDTSKEGGDTESIPYQRPWVRRLLDSVPAAMVGQGWRRSTLRTVLGNVCKPGSSEDLTYSRVRAALPVAIDLGADGECLQHFRHLLEMDYYYDPVVSVAPGSAPVFDLNVPDGSMFVANGLTNHNTEMSSCIAAYETYRLLAKGDPQTYYGIPPSENIQLISFATDKDQAGILYQKVSGYFRGCFAPETEIITGEGVKPIGSLVNTSPTILTRNGTWVQAPIRSFGVQQLYKLTLQRQGIEKVIYTTANHRWFARDARKAYRGQGFQEFTTVELRPGKHHLQTTFGKSYKERINPSPFGVAHGFVFGDGSTTAGYRNATTAHLYGEKDSHLLPYFSMCPQRRGDVRADLHAMAGARNECSVEVSARPNFFRDLPSITENKAYLLGWAMGYFAADGCSSSSGVEIVGVERKNIEFFRDVCVLLGIGTYDVRQEDKVSNITGKPFTLFKLKLMRGTLDESFFVLPSHREAFRALGGDDVRRKVLSWTVKSVEPTDRFEEVYCATVEGHGDFVLSGNIATGNCAFFAPYTANNTQTYARFQTPKDIERYGSYQDDDKAKATIKVTFRSSVAKGSRGAGNIVVILDEMAHFTDNGQSSADAVYDAVVPSTTTFSPKNPLDRRQATGPLESKIIAISSPLGKQGAFYNLFQKGFAGGAIGRTRLCFQAPTWEVNTTISADAFESEYVKDPRTFFTEFGADFSDRTRGWLDGEADLMACVNPDLRPRQKAAPLAPHFMGIDFALVGDASAIAIGHLDEKGRIVLDVSDSIQAGMGDFENQERLEFADVVDWIYGYTRRFYITEAIFDQWAGIPFEQALQSKGLKQFEMVHHTQQLTSQMYQNFKDMMYDKRLMLYDWPIPNGKAHGPLIEQLLELQAEVKSKYVTLVAAPKGQGKHDDLADALVRMVWLASQKSPTTVTHLAGHARRPGVNPLVQRTASQAIFRAKQKTFQTGSSPERQVPKKPGFGSKGRGGGPGGSFGFGTGRR